MPGFVKGYIFDKVTNAKIAGATIKVVGVTGSYTSTNTGAYLIQLNPGSYTLKVSKTGYATASQSVNITSSTTTTINIGLTPS